MLGGTARRPAASHSSSPAQGNAFGIKAGVQPQHVNNGAAKSATNKQLSRVHHERQCACMAADAEQSAAGTSEQAFPLEKKSSGEGLTYTYHSDGHYKATIEGVFGGKAMDVSKLQQGKAPWRTGWQMNEKNLKWNDELKKRLLVARTH